MLLADHFYSCINFPSIEQELCVWKIYQTAASQSLTHISKHLEVCQKYSATRRRIFNSLLSYLETGQTQPFLVDLLYQSLLQF